MLDGVMFCFQVINIFSDNIAFLRKNKTFMLNFYSFLGGLNKNKISLLIFSITIQANYTHKITRQIFKSPTCCECHQPNFDVQSVRVTLSKSKLEKRFS